jgi:hypothetical protein
MDIAFINRALGMQRGGGEIWDLEMAKTLHSIGNNITIYTGEPLLAEPQKNVNLPVKWVKSPFLYDLGYSAPIGIGGVITDLDRQLFTRKLRQNLKGEHDIIHINGYPEILRIRKKINTPMTIKLNGPPHSLLYDYFHPTKSSYSWLNQADAVISTGVTEEEIEEMLEDHVE